MRALLLVGLLALRALPEGAPDVRGFLPGNTLAYVEMTSLQETWGRLRTLSLEGLFDDERARREKLLADAKDALVNVARDRAGLHVEGLLGEVEALRWALLGLESEGGRLHPRMIFEIEVRSPEFLEASLREIVGDRLRGESELEGFKTYEVWVGLTEPRVDSVYAAVLGTAAVLSTRKEDLATVLANARAGGAHPSLLDNPHFQKAREKGGSAPFLLGFADAKGIVGAWLSGLDRTKRMETDKLETWFGFRSLTTIALAGHIEADHASFALSAGVADGADLYQAIRQDPAEFDSLRLFPPDALNVDAILLHDPPKLWERLSAFLKERLETIDPDGGEEAFDSSLSEVEDRLGAPVPEVLGVLGDEAALGVLRTPGQKTSERDIVLAFQIKDREAASKLLDRVKQGGWAKDWLGEDAMKSESYQEETLFYGESEKSLSYVFLDRYLVFSLDVGRLKRVVDTYKSGDHVGKSPLYLEARKAVPDPASKVVYANLSGLFELLLTRLFEETPEEFRKGTAEGGVVLITCERPDELTIEAGLGLKGASAAAATAIGYALPKLIESHQEELRKRCLARIEVLGTRARDWADKHGGEFPLTVDELGIAPEAFRCDADPRKPAEGTDRVVSYRYVPIVRQGPSVVLFYEDAGVHPDGRAVCTADGESEFVIEEVFGPQMSLQIRTQLAVLDKHLGKVEEKLSSATDEERPALQAEKKGLEARKAALDEVAKAFP